MSLTISDAGINVQISRETRSPTQRGFGSLLFMALVPVVEERIKAYTSLRGVSDDYDSEDEAYKAASSYFSQSPAPIDFLVGQVVEGTPDIIGVAASGTFDLTGLIAAGDGAVGLSIDAADYSISPAANDDEGIMGNALIALINAGGTHTAVYDTGIITITDVVAGVVGNDVVFTDLTDDTGVVEVPTVSPTGGVDEEDATAGESLSDALDSMMAINSAFYVVALDQVFNDDVANSIDVATWTLANERMFYAQTADPLTLIHDDISCIMALFQISGYDRTVITYSTDADAYICCSAFAVLATTSFRGTNTLKTLKFKNMPGVAIEDISSADLGSIKIKNGNVFYSTAGIRMFDSGITSGGSWADEIHGADALAEEIRVRVFGLLARVSTKVPYNEPGMALLEAEVEGSLGQYVTNGYLTDRVDTEGNILPAYEIWHVAVIDAAPQDKSARIAPDIEFTARLAGAIHSVLINGVLTLD